MHDAILIGFGICWLMILLFSIAPRIYAGMRRRKR
jgi:hypothetical protein